jgi:urease alpha subunit
MLKTILSITLLYNKCTTPLTFQNSWQATDSLPLNFGFSGKGNSSKPEGLREMIQAGCAVM